MTGLNDTQHELLGEGGVADEAKASLAQFKAAIADARESLKKVDLILADAQKIAGNAKSASQDLDVLRAEVDASLRKLNALVDDCLLYTSDAADE